MTSVQPRRHGFSLIEMMVVVLMMGIVTAQMFLVFSAQKRVYLANDRALEVQEGARLVSDLLAHDARASGFMVPPSAGVSSFDGGNAGADRLCVSDPDIFATPLDGTPSPVDNRTSPFGGASVTAAAGTNLTLPAADLDIDADGDIDFLAAAPLGAGNGGGIIFSDGVRTHCAQLDMVTAAGQITLVGAHLIPGGNFPVLANVRAVPAIIYEVGPNRTLMRNGVVLSTDIEDL